MYAGCPVLWCCRLQTGIVLITTEAEYIALGQSMHKVITFMVLTKIVYFIFVIYFPKLEVFCKVFEENQIFIAFSESNKFSLRTKHIDIKYHHLRSFVQKKIIRICYTDTG